MLSKQKSLSNKKHHLPGRRVLVDQVLICCTKLFDLFLMAKEKDHNIEKSVSLIVILR